MLYRLEIENFYSVRDTQVLDLRVPRNVQDYPERFAPLFPGSEERAPKVVAAFGANGAGKSTLLKAISCIAWFVRESYDSKAQQAPFEHFNDEASRQRPVRLAVEFGGTLEPSSTAHDHSGEDQKRDIGTLRYELAFALRPGTQRDEWFVAQESLRQKRQGQGKWLRIFERQAGPPILGSKAFPLGGYSQVIDKMGDGVSLVAHLAEFKHAPARAMSNTVAQIYRNILFGRAEASDEAITRLIANQPGLLAALNTTLQRIDVGVESMTIERTPSGPLLLFHHQGLHQPMTWWLQSQGTQSFIRIFPLLLAALNHGGIAVIDELDISIHPLLLPEIIGWFYDPDRNPHDAQLWMSCHSASLLDDLTKEEVVFCEKDRQGRTSLYSLMDVQAVRRADNLYKKYLGGVYGAVPQIG